MAVSIEIPTEEQFREGATEMLPALDHLLNAVQIPHKFRGEELLEKVLMGLYRAVAESPETGHWSRSGGLEVMVSPDGDGTLEVSISFAVGVVGFDGTDTYVEKI